MPRVEVRLRNVAWFRDPEEGGRAAPPAAGCVRGPEAPIHRVQGYSDPPRFGPEPSAPATPGGTSSQFAWPSDNPWARFRPEATRHSPGRNVARPSPGTRFGMPPKDWAGARLAGSVVPHGRDGNRSTLMLTAVKLGFPSWTDEKPTPSEFSWGLRE